MVEEEKVLRTELEEARRHYSKEASKIHEEHKMKLKEPAQPGDEKASRHWVRWKPDPTLIRYVQYHKYHYAKEEETEEDNTGIAKSYISHIMKKLIGEQIEEQS